MGGYNIAEFSSKINSKFFFYMHECVRFNIIKSIYHTIAISLGVVLITVRKSNSGFFFPSY